MQWCCKVFYSDCQERIQRWQRNSSFVFLSVGFFISNVDVQNDFRIMHNGFVYEKQRVLMFVLFGQFYCFLKVGISIRLTIHRYFLYTLLCFRTLFRSVDSLGKGILFCNFWLSFGLKRIANVYDFQRWLFISILYFSICLFQFSLFKMLSVGFCFIIGS